MRKTIYALAAMACMALTISTSFGQEPDKKTEKAKEDLQEKKIEVVEAKQDLKEAQNDDYLSFKKESEMKIKNNSESITDLNVKILKIDEMYRASNQIRVNELEQKNICLQKELDGYTDEGSEKWVAFKFKFNYDMDELVKALKDFSILNVS